MNELASAQMNEQLSEWILGCSALGQWYTKSFKKMDFLPIFIQSKRQFLCELFSLFF